MPQGYFGLEYAVRICLLAGLGMGVFAPTLNAAEPKTSNDQFLEVGTPVSAQPNSGNSVQQPAQPVQAVPAAPVSAAQAPKSGPQVRLVGMKTDVAKRYKNIVPPLPVPPFTSWRKWLKEHEESVHCALEWCDDNGNWWHGELRSTNFDTNAKRYRVGWGEFPGTGYDAYGVFLIPGRLPRDKDDRGRPLTVTLDEEIKVEYRRVVEELCGYAAKNKRWGDPGTGGGGKTNVGLGGPAYKPSQNSNTMVNYVLKRCGVNRPAPDMAVGWDTVPHFPYSSNVEAIPLDTQP